ncbi:MAG: cytochrome c [Gammaproteobacteria bacterium]|nr:cytochrome c [Gammaproteobacteria bacterium]
MKHFEWTQKLSLFTLIVFLIILLSACGKDQHNHPELKTGKDFFEYHCAACHKKDGQGMFLKGIPANVATNKNQAEIILHIKEGSQSDNVQMPVYKNMPDDEAQKIALYLLLLKKNFFKNPDNQDKVLLKR